MSTLEIVKSDFSEFTTTMTADTTNLIQSATAQFVESSNTATFLLDSFDNKVKLETSNRGFALTSASAIQDRYENELKALQLSEATYLSDAAPAHEFAKWQQSFEPDANKAAISDLLIENSSMRLIYSKLVPAQISNDQFWCRYFFKANVFEEEHRKRIKLLERVKDVASKEQDAEEGAADWDEDEDEDEDEEPAEEDKTINNSGQSAGGSEPPSPQQQADDAMSREVAQLTIEEQTKEALSEISGDVSEIAQAANDNFEDKVAKAKSDVGGESMVSSVKTEDSDDWDKVSDQANEDESDSAATSDRKDILSSRAKSAAKPDSAVASKTSTLEGKDKPEDNNDDWDDWGE